jgi:hypothetical protein
VLKFILVVERNINTWGVIGTTTEVSAAKSVLSVVVAYAGPNVRTCAATEVQYHIDKSSHIVPNPYSYICEGSAAAAGSLVAGLTTAFEASSHVRAGAGAGPSPAAVDEGPLPASDGGTGSTSAASSSAPSRPPRSSTPSACAICSTLIQQNHTYPHI